MSNGLADVLLAPPQRDAVIAETVQLIESRISRIGGLKGISLKTGLAMVKAAKPGIMQRATQRLLPEFIAALDPLYQSFRSSAERDFSAFLRRHDRQVTAALLTIADARVRQASPGVQSSYSKFRSLAEDEVRAAVPDLAKLIRAHLP
ncbi:MAG TPA: hypothetical protein VGE51_05210 [Fontimonas sp.]